MRLSIKIVITLLLMSLSGYAVSGQTKGLAVEQWLITMNDLMPAHFCSEEHFIRKQLNSTETECIKYVTDLMSSCMNGPMKSTPQTLFSKEEAEVLGESLGMCVFRGHSLKQKKVGGFASLTILAKHLSAH